MFKVSTPGNELAAAYIYEEGLKLAALAEARPDLEVTVRCLAHKRAKEIEVSKWFLAPC